MIHVNGRMLAAFLWMAAGLAAAGELPPNQWVAMNEPNVGVELMGWDEIRYCPDLEGMLFYGACRTWTSENQNAVWLYRFKENRWHLLYTNLSWARNEMSSDGGHTAGKMFYDETRKVLVYGGLVSMSTNDRMRTWVFDPHALVGWDASPKPSPNIEYNAASAYIPDLKASFSYESSHGAWLYDAVKNQWSQLAPAGNGPPPVTDGVYDAKRKRVLCFGGQNPKAVNDTWAFDISSKTWQKLNCKNAPPARYFPNLAISPVADIMLLHSGFKEEWKDGLRQQFQDTWALNLETMEWQELPIKQPPHSAVGLNNHLAYDPINDVFLFLGGWPPERQYGGKTPNFRNCSYGCAMYGFKYQGKNAAKIALPTVEPPPVYDLKSLPKAIGSEWSPLGAGVLSGLGGWAVRPSLVSTGNELLLAFGEYPPPTKDAQDYYYCGVYAFKYAGGQWTQLGTRVSTLADVHAQTPAAAFDSAGKPVVAYSSGAIGLWKILIKRFDADWKLIGEPSPESQSALPVLAGGSSLAVAWQHHPRGSCQDYGCAASVAEEESGSKWKASTSAPVLNVFPFEESRAQLLSLLRDSKNRLVAAWQEQNYAKQSPKHIYVHRMESGKWTELAKEVPISSPQANANAYALTLHADEPAVAVCEGIDGGHAQVFVYAWSGGQWSKLGDALNVLGPDGGAFRPAIASDGKSIFVAWPEYLPNRPPLLFVKKWDGSKWTLCGGPLNDAIGKGAATDPVMAILNGKPVVAWTEAVPCGEKWQQVFVKSMK